MSEAEIAAQREAKIMGYSGAAARALRELAVRRECGQPAEIIFDVATCTWLVGVPVGNCFAVKHNPTGTQGAPAAT